MVQVRRRRVARNGGPQAAERTVPQVDANAVSVRSEEVDPSLPRCSYCHKACTGAEDEELIQVCCCDRYVHATCHRKCHVEKVKTYMMEAHFLPMPLSEIWDCAECGSTYRLDYKQSVVIKYIVQRPALWPWVFIVFCIALFLLSCEFGLRAAPSLPPQFGFTYVEGERLSYFVRGADIVFIATTFLRVKHRGILFFARLVLGDPAQLTFCFQSLVQVSLVAGIFLFMLISMARDLYMSGLLLIVEGSIPSAFMAYCKFDKHRIALEHARHALHSSNRSDAPESPRNSSQSDTHAFATVSTSTAEGEREEAGETPGHDSSVGMESSEDLGKSSLESSMVASAEAQAFDAHQRSTPAVEVDASGECVICYEAKAQFVAEACGHLVLCRDCRRCLVYKELHRRGVEGLPKMRFMPGSMISETVVPCPVCRSQGLLLHSRLFKGKIFMP